MVWLGLKGAAPDRYSASLLCGHAERFAKLLRAEGFRILNDVVFNQVLVACDTPEHTKATLEKIQKSGECWCGGAVWKDGGMA